AFQKDVVGDIYLEAGGVDGKTIHAARQVGQLEVAVMIGLHYSFDAVIETDQGYVRPSHDRAGRVRRGAAERRQSDLPCQQAAAQAHAKYLKADAEEPFSTLASADSQTHGNPPLFER